MAGGDPVTWLLVTGAGLVAETAVIVVLGSRVTARYDAEKWAPRSPVLAAAPPAAPGRPTPTEPPATC